MPTFKYKNGTTWTTIPSSVNAGFAAPTATINNATGTPSCTVTYTGDDSARKYNFAFTNVKGAAGATGGTGAQGNSGNTLGTVTRRLSSNVSLPSLASASNPSTMAINYNLATTITGDGTLISATRGVRLTGTAYLGVSACIGLTNMTVGSSTVYTYIGWANGSSFPTTWTNCGTHQGKDQWMYIPQLEVSFPENITHYVPTATYTMISLFAKYYQGSTVVQARAEATILCATKYA